MFLIPFTPGPTSSTSFCNRSTSLVTSLILFLRPRVFILLMATDIILNGQSFVEFCVCPRCKQVAQIVLGRAPNTSSFKLSAGAGPKGAMSASLAESLRRASFREMPISGGI